jgi:hypothetical protein
MRTLVMTVTLEAEGRPYGESPLRVSVSAPLGRTFSYEISAGGGLALIPGIVGLSQITSFVLTTTAAVTFWINGQGGDGIPIEAGGLVALFGLTDTIGDPLWQITNGGIVNARIRGVVLGVA